LSIAHTDLPLPTPPPPDLYTLSLHDALPISPRPRSSKMRTGSSFPCTCTQSSSRTVYARSSFNAARAALSVRSVTTICVPYSLRSEEHTSELQSRFDLVCRLLLEKKKKRLNHRIKITSRVTSLV